MDIRLIAFDLDGTLLGEGGCVLESNSRALRAAEEKGIRLVLNSGRNFEKVREFGEVFGISPAICSLNGARVDLSPEGPTVYRLFYREDCARELCRVIERSGLYFNVDTPGHTYLGNIEAGRSLPVFFYQLESGVPKDFERVEDPQRLWTEGMAQVYKFSAYGLAHDPRFQPICEAARELGLTAIRSNSSNIEIMWPGASKGDGLRRIAQALEIPRESVMAFGDNINDLSMLEYAGFPVAMENGENEVKEIARAVAPHHAQGGVGQFLWKNVLGEAM